MEAELTAILRGSSSATSSCRASSGGGAQGHAQQGHGQQGQQGQQGQGQGASPGGTGSKGSGQEGEGEEDGEEEEEDDCGSPDLDESLDSHFSYIQTVSAPQELGNLLPRVQAALYGVSVQVELR